MSTLPFKYAVLRIDEHQPWTAEIHHHDGRLEISGIMAESFAAIGQLVQNVVRYVPCAVSSPGAAATVLTPITTSNGTTVFFLEKAPAVVTVRYCLRGESHIHEFQFPHPRMLVAVKGRVSQGQFTHSDTFFAALREPLRSPNQIIYHYPGWNTFPEGRICWGTHRVPTCAIHEIVEIPNQHFEIIGNNDLDNTTRQDWGSSLEMLRELHDLVQQRIRAHQVPMFPVERLHAMGDASRPMTLTQWVAQFGGRLAW